MIDQVKAFIFVMGLAIPIFLLARRPLAAAGYHDDIFRRHRNIWICVTSIAFFTHNFWLFSAITAMVMLFAGIRDRAPLGLYIVALFAAPHFTLLLPGIGPIQNLFYFNHIRTLSLVVLLPLALVLRRTTRSGTTASIKPDLMVIGYILFVATTHARDQSFTVVLRTCFYLIVDIWLPYYVASRAITNMEQFRNFACALVMVSAILAIIGVFETTKGWLLYEDLRSPMGVPVDYVMYIARGEGGPLRALASTTYPIILAYVLTLGLGMYAFIAIRLEPTWLRVIACLCLIGGLIAPFSRGPWIGAAAMGLLIAIMGPGKGKRLTLVLGISGFSLLALLASPWGDTALDFLPFIGSVETENVDYRKRLFDVSMLVLAQNPLFGDLHFMENPLLEQMRQGQGIIDIVNTYLQVALPYGLLGLAIFIAALVLPMNAVWQARKKVSPKDLEAERLGRVLLAMMVGTLVTIGTASSIGAIGPMYWIITGLCVAYARMLTPPTGSQGKQKQYRRAPRQGRAIPTRQTMNTRATHESPRPYPPDPSFHR